MVKIPLFLRSLRHAGRGVVVVFRSEQSFRLQVVAGGVTLGLGLAFHVRPIEFIALILLVGAVLVLEMINSVLERVIDTIKPRLHPAVKDIKDMTAGAVLVVSSMAAVVGILIFWPYILALF